jgi:hypothetical protein
MASDPPTFSVSAGFLGAGRRGHDAAISVAGIPLDIGTTNRSGAPFGPQAIRQASRMLVDGAHPTKWIDVPELMLSDIGDFRIALGDIPASLTAIEEQAAAVDHLVALGGEHGITLPLLRALARRKGSLALVHFDANVDTWPDNFGQRYAHGSVYDGRRAMLLPVQYAWFEPVLIATIVVFIIDLVGNSIGFGNRFLSALMSAIVFALVFGTLVYFGYGSVSMSVTTTPSTTAPAQTQK